MSPCRARRVVSPPGRDGPRPLHRDSEDDGTARSLSKCDQVSSILKFTSACFAVNWSLVEMFLLFATLLIEMKIIKKNSWVCK